MVRHNHRDDRRRQIYQKILRRRHVRDYGNPFDVTYEEFTRKYRLDQHLTLDLVEMIRPLVRRRVSPLAVPLEIRV